MSSLKTNTHQFIFGNIDSSNSPVIGYGTNNTDLVLKTGNATRVLLKSTGETIFYNDVSMNSKLYIDNDVSFNSKLIVSGDVSLNSKLYVGGDVSLNSKLYVAIPWSSVEAEALIVSIPESIEIKKMVQEYKMFLTIRKRKLDIYKSNYFLLIR